MNALEIASLLIVLAGVFGSFNYLYLKLPSSIGILIVALFASIGVMIFDAFLPRFQTEDQLRRLVTELHFSDALLEGMLGLLLFAGALHVKVSDLRVQWKVVFFMATLGVALSTVIIGIGFSWITGMPLLVALVFGALISPTDPVAVLGVLRATNLPKSLETKIAGESLFNDGVGYVVFLVLVGLAFPSDHSHGTTAADAAKLFLVEAGGGAALGAALGFLTFRLMRRIDDPALEVLITLGLAFGGYQLSEYLHFSAPIMAVVAGLFIGDIGMKFGMSERTRDYVNVFWSMIDEILNAVLFLMIGFEVFAVAFSQSAFISGLGAIIIALIGRFAAVATPIAILKNFRSFSDGAVPIMTWGGLKGGISVALALSLPDSEYKSLILTCTYMVVIFSIIVQGLTVAKLAKSYSRTPDLM